MQIVEKDGSVSFSRVRVQPRASSDELIGEHQDELKIPLNLPPVEDGAIKALRNLLSTRLKVALAAVKIAEGERSRDKGVEIRGMTAAMIRELAG